ncbi:TonB-dependent receptor domain-containing protein [Sphingosinicella sp. CPCC 101087]|uniref:TonB-dependent receptor domain-containing protein n=1 Tax=Sphingosinicella sp. CPCC 101087 TaxID=2497754 RepID=UPI0013ECD287|nr:TonB-dependent receptor [Sphingosinicella sp. CPCC 101087]
MNQESQIRRSSRRRGRGAAVAASLFALSAAAPVSAQTEPASLPAPADSDILASGETPIIVTGSRIKRSGFQEQTPTTVISAEQIGNLGQISVSEVLGSIPQNLAAQSDTNTGPSVGSRASSNIGASYANLRGLNPFFGTRTLTLVDSRRFVPTSDSGAVDLNLIPSTLIARVETVTGGASAAYGSDAVAGVVNIILDTEFTGARVQLDYGETFRGEGRTLHGAAAFGTGFAGGRGHVVVSGEYQDSRGVGPCSEVRAWCAEGWDVYTNAGIRVNGVPSGYNVPGSPTYGQPNFILGPGSRHAYNGATGVIRNVATTPASLRNMQFTPDGRSLVPFDPGLYVQNSQIGPRQGGDGESTFAESRLRTPVERYALYGHLSYELTDSLNATLETSFGAREASAIGPSLGPASTLVFRPDNVFLPEEVRAALVGSPGFTLGKDLDNDFTNINRARVETFRAVAGLDGELGIGNLTWDAYFQFGRNTRHQSISHSRVNHFFAYAVDAVADPVTGEPVCRAVLLGNPEAEGCVPINLFGTGNLTPEGIAYAWREAIEDFEYTQHVIAGSVQGDLFSGIGAGPIGFAAGMEYRADSGDVTHGDVPYYNQFGLSLGLDYSGDISVFETFGEINVPLLRDVAAANLLELNGAVRYTRTQSTDGATDESRTVGAWSWKAGAVYEPVPWLRLRGTRSRDIRAAGFRELFQLQLASEPGSAQGRVNNPFNGNASDSTPIRGGGNFGLAPEKADTTTLGVVLRPLGNRLSFSADWFEIRIDDAVTTPSGQQIVDSCFNLDVFCERITFNPAVPGNGDVIFVDSRQLNLGSFTSRGIDLEVDYTVRLRELVPEWNGLINLRVVGTHLYDLLIQGAPGAPIINFAGQSGPNAPLGDFNSTPKWMLNSTLTLEVGRFTGVVQARYVGSGALSRTLIGPDDPDYDPTLINSINHNRVPSRTYVTLALTYRLPVGSDDDQFEIFGVVENLFDVDPPIAPGTTGSVVQSSYPTNPALFDTLGARFRTGVRARF